jgi:hypothetical protein
MNLTFRIISKIMHDRRARHLEILLDNVDQGLQRSTYEAMHKVYVYAR